MSPHLRPTRLQPAAVPGYILVTLPELATVVELAGLAGLALYCRVLTRAQTQRPCFMTTLTCQDPDNTEALARAAAALVQAQILTWVDETEEGGVA